MEGRKQIVTCEKRWFTTEEATEYTTLSRWTIGDEIKKGLPVSKHGKRVVFDKADLDRLMEGRKVILTKVEAGGELE